MIISIVSAKGGTGKSTITLNLAGMLAAQDHRVCVVDADPQGSIAHWSEIRQQDDPTIVVEPSPMPEKKIRKLNKRHDLVLFDSPPTFKKRMRAIMQAADLLIIPVTPGIADLWSTKRLVDVYLDVKEKKPDLDARILINRVDRRTRLGRDFRSRLEDMSIPIFLTEISQRSLYGESWIAGKTIDRLRPSSTATRELRRLSAEVTHWLAKSWLGS
jgi:chromosome partitioning protein